MGLRAVLDVIGHVAVERPHDPVALVDDRDGHPAVDEVLGHLQADVARADDDGLAAAALQARAEALRGVDRARGLRRLRAGDRRRGGDGTGRDDELVEALLGRALLGALVHGEDPAVEVDPPDLGAHAHVDPGLPVLLRRARDEPVGVVEQAADEVRDAAGGVRRVGPALEGDDVEIRVAALGRGGGAHPCGVAADDRQSHAGDGLPLQDDAGTSRGRDHRAPARRGGRAAQVIESVRTPGHQRAQDVRPAAARRSRVTRSPGSGGGGKQFTIERRQRARGARAPHERGAAAALRQARVDEGPLLAVPRAAAP